MTACPCDSGKNYDLCCGPYIDQGRLPATPEALMRSRYTAYSQVKIPYIAATMKSPASDHFSSQEAETWAKQVKWLHLDVLSSQMDGDQAKVEFKAHYLFQGREECLHEVSEFSRVDGRWYYVDGYSPEAKRVSSVKVQRNEPCPCGSGKKYKKCCA